MQLVTAVGSILFACSGRTQNAPNDESGGTASGGTASGGTASGGASSNSGGSSSGSNSGGSSGTIATSGGDGGEPGAAGGGAGGHQSTASGGELAQGGEPEPASTNCKLLRHVELRDEFVTHYDAGLARAGDAFIFLRDQSSAYQFATATWSGLGDIASVATSVDFALGGAVLNRTNGDKALLVVDRGAHGPHAGSWLPGQSEPLAQTDLFSAEFSGLTTRDGITSSWDGRRLWLAYGNIVYQEPIEVIALDAELQALTPPVAIDPGSDLFDALAIVNTANGVVVSFTTDDMQTQVWHVVEIDGHGNVIAESAAPLADPENVGPQTPSATLANSREFFALWRHADNDAVLTRMPKDNGSAAISTQSFVPGFWQNAALLAPFEHELIVSRSNNAGPPQIQRFDFDGNALSDPLLLPGTADGYASLLSIDGQTLTVAYRTTAAVTLAEVSCP